MRLFAKISLALAALIISVALAPSAKADAITISGGGFSLSNLGNDGTGAADSDSLAGAAASNTFNVHGGDSFIALLNPLTFGTGFTGANSGGSHAFTFSQLITINGQSQMMDIVGSIEIGHLVDIVHITSATPLTFNFNMLSVTVNMIPTDIFGWGPGTTLENLTARIDVTDTCNPVPEPATLTLFGLGLAGVATKLRQRRRARKLS